METGAASEATAEAAEASSSAGGQQLSGQALEALGDPNVVDKLIDELKSQGMFDQIRKDCLAEVDTKVTPPTSHY